MCEYIAAKYFAFGQVPKTGVPVHIEPKSGTYLNQVKDARHERGFWPMRKHYFFTYFAPEQQQNMSGDGQPSNSQSRAFVKAFPSV